MSLKSLTRQNYVNKSIQNSITPSGVSAPVITSIIICDSNYNNLDDTALDSSGSYVKLIGTGFKTGCTVYFNNESLTATFVSGTEVRIQTPATTVGAYNIMLFNPNNAGGAIYLNLSVSNVPSYTTASGSLGSYYEANTISNTIVATGDTPLSYSLYSGSLPAGATLNSDGTITGTSPAESGSTTYSFVVNVKDAQGQDATRSFSLTINTDPVTWSSPNDNQVISAYEYAPISNVTLSAATAAGKSITYSANALPGGITLNGSTISGTNNVVGNTYTRLTATAATTGRTATRDVLFNVNQDVVTWSSPANNTEYTIAGGSAMANVTMSATSAAGRSIIYSANALPSGVYIDGGTLYGTPDTAQTVYTLLTAQATTTNRTATRTISWTITLGDTYRKYNTLLLSADNTVQTPSFVSDNSLNNAQLTVVGDTTVSNFNPYQQGYYSIQFNGSSDFVTTSSINFSSISTGNYTIEYWMYANSLSGDYNPHLSQSDGGTGTFFLGTTGTEYRMFTAGTYYTTSGLGLVTNKWYHVAVVRNSGTVNIYFDGVSKLTFSDSTNWSSSFNLKIGSHAGVFWMSGYLTNMRITNNAVYTTTFTPPTSPLTTTANTKFLSCQSSRFIDSSVSNLTFTTSGTPKVSSVHPFSTVYQAGTQNFSSYYPTTNDAYIKVDTNSVMSLNGDFTVEFWYKHNNVNGSYTQFITKGNNDNSLKAEQVANSGYINFYFYNGTAYNYTNTPALAAGTWHHIAWVRSGSNSRLYINGVSENLVTTLTATIDWTTTCYIGAAGANTSEHLKNASMSNLRVVKGTALYDVNSTTITVPTSKLTAVSGTVLLTFQDNVFKDNSPNAYTITGTAYTANPAYYPTIRVDSPFTPSSYTNTEITTYGSGYFDGTGDYLTTPSNSALSLGTGDFTIECWAYVTSYLNGQLFGCIWDTRTTGTDATGHALYFRSSNSTFVYRYGATEKTTPYTDVPLNTWVHLAVVRSSSGTALYINGISIWSGLSVTNTFSASTYNIGRTFDNYYYTGYISDFRITKGTAIYTSNFVPQFTSTLTNVANTQLLTLQTNGGHNNNTFKDSSSFNNLITRNGNVTNGTFSPYGDNWSVYFNGTSYLNVPWYTTGTPFTSVTAEAWIYPTTLGNNLRIFGYVMDCYVTTTGKIGWYDYTYDLQTTNNVISPNTWTHVAFVANAGTRTIYVNGVAVATTGTNTGFTANGSALNIGYYTSAGYGWTGYISNVRISTNAIYTSNFTPSTSPLSPTANTVVLSCQSNRFIDSSIKNYTITTSGTPTVQKFSPFSTVTVPKYYSTYFDGTGDNLSTVCDLGTSQFTAECWGYMPNTATGAQQVLFSQYITAPNGRWAITVSASGYPEFVVNGLTEGNLNIVAGSTIQSGVWHHFAVTRNASNVFTFWVNGVSVGTGTRTGSLPSSSVGFTIGGLGNAGGTLNLLTGYVSNLRIVKNTVLYTSNFTPSTTPLTAVSGTVLLTCQDSTFKDNSTNNFTITAAGDAKPLPISPFTPTASSTTSYSPTVFGGSMYFDGTGDYLTISTGNITNFSSTSNWTVEAWIYPTVLTGGVYEQVIFGSGFSFGGYGTLLSVTNNSSGVVSGGTLTTNQWQHIAVVNVAGTSLKIYLNGVQVGSTSATSFSATTTYIGSNSTGGQTFTGYISDLRVTNGALYTSTFYPGSAPATPTTTIGTNTYSSTLLLNGTSGGVIDATRTVNLETVGDSKIVNGVSPYNGNYYSNYFDGNGDYLTTGTVPAISGDFTIEFWVKLMPAGVSPAAYPAAITHNSGYTNFEIQWVGGTTSWSNPAVYMGGGKVLGGTSTIPTGKWTHVAIVRSGTGSSNIKLFYDGVEKDYTTTNASIITGTYSIGQENGANYFLGNISNVRFSNIARYSLSGFTPPTDTFISDANTLLLTCQSNKFLDKSSNNITITKNGDAKVSTENPFQVNTGQSYYFDGTGDWLLGTNTNSCFNFGTGDFTIECWYNQTNTGAGTRIVSALTPYSTVGFALYFVAGYPAWYTGGAERITGTTFTAAGTWNHLAVVRSSGVTKIYINGSVAGPTYTDTTNYSGTAAYIGSDSTQNFNGYISDLRITKGYARYTTNFTPSTTTLKLK